MASRCRHVHMIGQFQMQPFNRFMSLCFVETISPFHLVQAKKAGYYGTIAFAIHHCRISILIFTIIYCSNISPAHKLHQIVIALVFGESNVDF